MTELVCNIAELEAFEKEKGRKFDFIKLSLVDLNCFVHSRIVNRSFIENILSNGLEVYAGLIARGITSETTEVKELIDMYLGNCHLVPITNTLHVSPWNCAEGKISRFVGEIYCEAKWIPPYKDGEFIQSCPRTVLRKTLEQLEDAGFFAKSAFEIEFSVLNASSNDIDVSFPSFHKDPQIENILLDVMQVCNDASLKLKHFHLEGLPCQFEINMQESEGLSMADDMLFVKKAVKEVFRENGFLSSFMTYCKEGYPENSFHLNLSLWQTTSDGEKRNVFYDSDDPNRMSEVCKQFLSGLIKHSKALTAIFCPTVNCYRKFGMYMSPRLIDWNIDDRSVSYRVKTGKSTCYLENRLPSSSCNPYLTTAATIVAGMDGIRNKLQLCPPNQTHPCKHDEKEFKDTLSDFPSSLQEALCELEKCQVLRDGLGGELVDWFVKMKRYGELEAFKNVTEEKRFQTERKLYLHTF